MQREILSVHFRPLRRGEFHSCSDVNPEGTSFDKSLRTRHFHLHSSCSLLPLEPARARTGKKNQSALGMEMRATGLHRGTIAICSVHTNFPRGLIKNVSCVGAGGENMSQLQKRRSEKLCTALHNIGNPTCQRV